ncbi:hypothetical protein [Microbacterium aurugineum]|uniref:hypothetical protein n=1 Tax=Microbacterium aurugineum TaxID=2851642 RepID=UPI0020C12DB8|nr:hypothetical protein [Microbacterium aurugineum]MCK8475646.1 hypothetical protein [Microbacterium aurugineum]
MKDQASWKMPLDEFYVYSPELDNYAELLLTENCLEDRGYDLPVPWQNTDYPQPEDFNAIGFRLFNLDLAKKWGYGFAPAADEESARLWQEFITETDPYFKDAEYQAVFDECTDEIRVDDPDFQQNFDGESYLAGLALQADGVVLQDAAVVEATARWRECLAPQVDFALPDDPRTGMPPAESERVWKSEGGEASAAEIRDAIADAECRESSGLTAVAYERNWEEQQKLVDENRDKLDRIRSEAVERKAKLLTIVAENAPAAP